MSLENVKVGDEVTCWTYKHQTQQPQRLSISTVTKVTAKSFWIRNRTSAFESIAKDTGRHRGLPRSSPASRNVKKSTMRFRKALP